METVLTIGEISRRSGVPASALRYYEELGLITSERAGSGHRRFPRYVLRRIAFIVFAQKIGMSLSEVNTELAKLPTAKIPTSKDWEKLSGRWVKRVDEQIEALQKLRTGLQNCIGCGCLSFEACKFANPDDRNGRAGPGPRFWV